MAKCIVIGGGLAGISATVYLSKIGNQVTLIESSPKLGGRTYSLFDTKTNTEIDNGQHIMMGAYKHTFDFLKLIDANSIPEYQTKMSVDFIGKGNNKFKLEARNKLYPINLAGALFRFEVLSFKEKISVFKFLIKLFIINSSGKFKNVNDWLLNEHQTENTINMLWEPICIGALNTRIEDASPIMFAVLIKEIFFKGNKNSTFVLTSKPLNRLFIEPTINYFKANDIEYHLSEKIVLLNFENNILKKINTSKREITDFDFVILAIPPYSIKQINSNFKILSDEILNMDNSTIVTVHLWTKDSFNIDKFAGLLNSPIHWIFNNGNHYSVVISSADKLIEMDSEDIYKLVINELLLYFPEFEEIDIYDYKVIKEKRATIKSNLTNEKLREEINSPIPNLIFAGDWTNTKLPGTIEGAILSGKKAAEKIIC